MLECRVGGDHAAGWHQGRHPAREPCRELGVRGRVPGAEIVVDQRGEARQPAAERRQGLTDVANDQMPVIGQTVRVRRWLPLEHEDLATGVQLAQMIVGPAVAEAELEDRAGEPVDPCRGRVEAGPLRLALSAIAARSLGTRASEPLCYARLGDYARERVGLSARQLQDLARAHRALRSLPRLAQALLANELPWSKVRLLARVATPQDEEAWTAPAGALPLLLREGVVGRVVAAAAPAGRDDVEEDPEDAGSRTRVTLRCSPAVREKWLLAREMAERVAGQRLRAEEAIEWITAEACSALAIAPAGEDLGDEDFESAADGPRETIGDEDESEDEPALDRSGRVVPAPAPVLAEIAAITGALEDADPFELDRRLRRAVAIEQTLDAAMAPLLRVIASPDYEWEHRYRTLETHVTEHLGMSASKARALLRVERAGDVCLELREAFRGGSLSWAKAQCLVPLLLLDLPGEWRPRWVAWAERVTVRRLEADVALALLLRAGHARAWQRCQFHPERAQDPIPETERQMCAAELDLEATEKIVWNVPRDVAYLFDAMREAFRVRLRAAGVPAPSDGQAFEALLDHALAAWSVRDPAGPRRDPVIERDGYRCAVPGCSSRRNLHDHHILSRSAGGSHAAENRVTLCAFHHLRGLHAGRLRIRGRAPGHLEFDLGVRAGAAPLARYLSGDIAVSLPELTLLVGGHRAA